MKIRMLGVIRRHNKEDHKEEGSNRGVQRGRVDTKLSVSDAIKYKGGTNGVDEMSIEGGKSEETGELDVMKELNQNRLNQIQELAEGKNRGRTWKRRSNTKGNIGKKEQDVGIENRGSNVCTNGKRGFSLIDEKETLEEIRGNEKKLKMVIDEMQLCQVLVEEANQKWPQPDQ